MFPLNTTFAIIGVTRSITHTYKKTKSRKNTSLYFKLSGSMLYTINGENFTMNAGDILFIPKNSEYVIQEIEKGEYISLHIDIGCISKLAPMKYCLFNNAKDMFTELWQLWQTDSAESAFECYSIAYKLFAQIVHFENINYDSKHKKSLISDSIEYMEQNMFKRELDVASLAVCSGISYIYFYKLFKEFYNCSPCEYIKNKRIIYAKSLLTADETLPVSQVAEMVGYSDPLYFSRLFKKETGYSPKEFIKHSSIQ